MLNELSRMVKAWLADSSTGYGLADMLDKVAILDGDTRPAAPASIYCDAEDECVAERINPTASPSIVVLSDGDVLSPLTRIQRQYVAERNVLAVLYCVNDAASLIQSRKDAGYVMAAVVDSLWALQEPSRAGDRKFFNDCELIAWKDVTVLRAGLREERINIIAAVFAAAHMRRTLRS